MRSDPKYDWIPLILIMLSTVVTLVESPVVCEVETIGDWIKLSSATKHLEF